LTNASDGQGKAVRIIPPPSPPAAKPANPKFAKHRHPLSIGFQGRFFGFRMLRATKWAHEASQYAIDDALGHFSLLREFRVIASRERLHVLVALVLVYDAIKGSLKQKNDELTEYVLSAAHVGQNSFRPQSSEINSNRHAPFLLITYC
jgi:hypothetical protein